MTIIYDKNIRAKRRDSMHVWAFAGDTLHDDGQVNIDMFERAKTGGATLHATVNLSKAQALELVESVTAALRAIETSKSE